MPKTTLLVDPKDSKYLRRQSAKKSIEKLLKKAKGIDSVVAPPVKEKAEQEKSFTGTDGQKLKTITSGDIQKAIMKKKKK